MEDRSLALGEVAREVLEKLVRERLSRKPGAHLVEGALDRIPLAMTIDPRGGATATEAFSKHLVEEIDRILDEAIQHAARFRPGHAFCHRCGVTPCEHSQAPSHRHVFAGYTPNGVPRWEEFGQLCLDRRHPDVDRLYAETPAFVTIVQTGRELNAVLVPAFQQPAGYELRGQVAAGLIPVRARDGEGRGVLAVTFQVGMSRGAGGHARWGLNVLGRTPQGEPLENLWERQDVIPWQGAVRWAQAALSTLERRRKGKAADDEPRLEGILAGLARRLAHERRAAGRKTRHGQVRHTGGERPTRKALDDARVAGRGDILFDERHGTLVVAGERGRMHFYATDGRLVSSVHYSRDAIERKRKLGIWREATAAEAASLIARLTPSGEAPSEDATSGVRPARASGGVSASRD